MAKPWDEGFNFYMGTHDGVPFLNSIDLGASDHVPVSTHPLRMTIRVRMLQPLENGLRSPAESDALADLEVRLAKNLGAKLNAIYWGKRIMAGWTYFYLQIPEGLGEHLAADVNHAVRTDEYRLELAVAPDAQWQLYREIYPNEYQLHTMWNRQQQLELQDLGDSLSKPRRVDHLALFPSVKSANDAARLLKKSKFRLGRVLPTDSDDPSKAIALHFHRKDACDGLRPDDITAQILDCVEPSGGSYDGWGCAVAK